MADKLNNSPKVPLSNNRIVDAAEIGQLLERLRISVPSSIMESERTLAERERILGEAEAEGRRILERAKQRAADLLSQDSLVNMARRESERMLEEARATASQRMDEADSYATDVLEDLGGRVSAIARQVDNGLQMMKGRRQEASRAPSSRPAENAQRAPDARQSESGGVASTREPVRAEPHG